MNQFRLTPTARRDLKAIKDFIAEKNLEAAFRFVDQVVEKCQTLAQFPEMGRLWSDLAPPLRSFPVDSYLIFYRPLKDGIQIVRIVNGYRDLDKLLLRDDE